MLEPARLKFAFKGLDANAYLALFGWAYPFKGVYGFITYDDSGESVLANK
jgi:hypothetical protein